MSYGKSIFLKAGRVRLTLFGTIHPKFRHQLNHKRSPGTINAVTEKIQGETWEISLYRAVMDKKNTFFSIYIFTELIMESQNNQGNMEWPHFKTEKKSVNIKQYILFCFIFILY